MDGSPWFGLALEAYGYGCIAGRLEFALDVAMMAEWRLTDRSYVFQLISLQLLYRRVGKESSHICA